MAVDGSIHLLDILEHPALVVERLKRPIEPENREPALASNGLDPVFLLAGRHRRTEIDIDGPSALIFGSVYLLTDGNFLPFCSSDRLKGIVDEH